MNITALRSYSRVIVSRRQGKCYACGTLTASGRDYAAVTADGKWHAYCLACAASMPAQIAGLVKRVETAVAAAQVAIPATALPDERLLVEAMRGEATEAQAYDCKVKLLGILTYIADAKADAAASDNPLLPALRAIRDDANASPRNREFARSLVEQGQRRPLSPKQVDAAEGMIARLAKPGVSTNGAAAVNEVGVYVNAAGVIVKVQRGRQSGTLYGKVWDGQGFQYQPNLASDTSLRPITAAEAAAFGHQHDHCVFCWTPLSDDGPARSVQVGYGPVCAGKYGLPWG